MEFFSFSSDFEKIYDKSNEDALDAYRLGLAVGDLDIITGVAADSFNFTWVPDNKTVDKDDFSEFFANLKAGAEEDGRPRYFMKFENLIQRKVMGKFDICFTKIW